MTFEKGIIHCSGAEFQILKTYMLNNSVARSLILMKAPTIVIEKAGLYERSIKEIIIQTVDQNTFDTISFIYDPFLRG